MQRLTDAADNVGEALDDFVEVFDDIFMQDAAVTGISAGTFAAFSALFAFNM